MRPTSDGYFESGCLQRGKDAVERAGGIPRIAETQRYVREILPLYGGDESR